MSRQPLTPWLFGKLPALGDFVSRGLDMATRERLDVWLSGEMEGARLRWAEAFEARYDAAPAWTFVDCDEDGRWTGGAMCASVDRAGRRFPLLAAAPAADAARAASTAGAMIEVMSQGFVEAWDADRLLAAELADTTVSWAPDGPEWALVGVEGPVVRLSGRFPQGVVDRMLELAA
jgi:type VI secretion system ImpM family protein